ncbi:vesicular integral-membrane protein vip36 [Malassezia pachydermatis]|uniref:Vesicular integral-membrane protein vip36 n=1 Tax=Malassezia pachydermatis TaxID=77020 RepID=A0A0M8MUG3_9BASI|nr:vesicular integral-membrane protein vip36 [Malassezia pachydermatis]KOS14020.1 vesicular integral-membrane protein vip36 [Malassezia pachydermatis]
MLCWWAHVLVAVLAYASGVWGARASASNPELKADGVMPVRTHSLFSPYVDSSLQNNYWDYGGDAVIDTNRYVMLTQDRRNESGWLWSRLPLEASDFEITVEFSLKGKSPSVAGDGFAMWLSNPRAKSGPVFGSANRWKGLGIFFDTYANTPHRGFFPRISAVRNNGGMDYDISRDGENQDMARCSMQLRRTEAETRLRFTYVKDVYMELAIQNMEWNKWSTCFKVPPVDFTDAPYLGFSASTGDMSDNHNIVSVWTNRLVYNSRTPADLEAERKLAFAKSEKKSWWSANSDSDNDVAPKKGGRRDRDQGGSSLLAGLVYGILRLIKWAFIFAVVGAGGFYGFKYYKKRSRSGFKNRRMMA